MMNTFVCAFVRSFVRWFNRSFVSSFFRLVGNYGGPVWCFHVLCDSNCSVCVYAGHLIRLRLNLAFLRVVCNVFL